MGIKRFGILSFLKSAFDAMPATIEGQLMKIRDVLVSVNDGLDQCPAGTRTRPATRYFFRYPTRPDSVLEIIG